jgi:molybdopterin/thiamine biosynthesis adenylyltransferase
MSARFELRMTGAQKESLWRHLFRPDRDEYGAIALAGVRENEAGVTLYVREVRLLGEDDFVPGVHGYRQFSALAVAEMGGRAAAEELAYVAIHSHPHSVEWTGLSGDDLGSHERLFPHLLDLTGGMPVAGIAVGRECAAGEIWRVGEPRAELSELRVVGPRLERLRADNRRGGGDGEERFDRQVRLFGARGQEILRSMHVGVIGAGGGGSILVEQLAHLGVGGITVVDFDIVKTLNLSRIVGATAEDARIGTKKIEVARRLVAGIDPRIEVTAIDGDIADLDTARWLIDLDFLFLATDTMTSRLIFNAVVHQYLIPGIQIGAKVELGQEDRIAQIYVAVRPVLPDAGCLQCNGLIDAMALQQEARSEEEAAAQNYLGTAEVIDPSVITLNGIAASHAANTMLLAAVGLQEGEEIDHKLFFPAEGEVRSIVPRRDPVCPFCGQGGNSSLARGEPSSRLPCRRQRT